MSSKRQKNQYELAFMQEAEGEALRRLREGTELPVAKQESKSPVDDERLMEEVCERDNLLKAWKRVRANKGSAGVDGRSIEDTLADLREGWPAIRDQLLNGTYRPQPVRRVEIPKPAGGVRTLGIPTVTDRLIQQAIHQELDTSRAGEATSATAKHLAYCPTWTHGFVGGCEWSSGGNGRPDATATHSCDGEGCHMHGPLLLPACPTPTCGGCLAIRPSSKRFRTPTSTRSDFQE